MNSDILKEQVEYYRQRASEYDEWFFRQGRYYRGEEQPFVVLHHQVIF